jgi:DNA-nicking Smr family endonuclease
VSKGDKKKPAAGPFEALRTLRDELKKKSDTAKGERAEGPPVAPAKQRPAPSTSAPSPPRTLGRSDEDEALAFHRLMSGVEPLKGKAARVPRSKNTEARSPDLEARRKHAETVAQAEDDAVHEHIRTLIESGGRFEVSDDGRRVEGRRIDVPPDLVRKLRRGMLPIDARMDLHGLRVAEGRTQLELFLRTMRARGERCVLVVHGKGEHSPRGVGVLRGEIAAWLSQGAASADVAAFATASEGDGGEGAVYVLLRH